MKKYSHAMARAKISCQQTVSCAIMILLVIQTVAVRRKPRRGKSGHSPVQHHFEKVVLGG
jgi:hypothetical protein